MSAPEIIKVTSESDPSITATVEFGVTAVTIRVGEAQPESLSPLAANALIAAVASYNSQPAEETPVPTSDTSQ